MRKIKTSLILGLAVIFFGLTIKVFGIPGSISMDEFANANEPENRVRIAEKVLVSTGRTDMFTPEEARDIRVNYGELTKKGVQDALVTVDFGPEATVMAVYTPTENGYEYAGEVGYFYDVDNITFIKPNLNGLDVITFRERNNQSIGGLERSSFIRGYGYGGGAFRNVINIDENIESWWNDTYTGSSTEPVWHKITQTSNIQNSDNDKQIDATKTQVYSVAENTNSKSRPADEEFEERNRRTVEEVFRWNDEWQRFIVGEKIENATGEKVAVIKDFGASPYVLTGDLFNKYRIVRNDGTVDVVDYEDVSELPAEQEQPAFNQIG